MKMDDWTGRRVRLCHDLETASGRRFAKGAEMVVRGHHRGRLMLRYPADDAATFRIRKVATDDGDLLPLAPEPPA